MGFDSDNTEVERAVYRYITEVESDFVHCSVVRASRGSLAFKQRPVSSTSQTSPHNMATKTHPTWQEELAGNFGDG